MNVVKSQQLNRGLSDVAKNFRCKCMISPRTGFVIEAENDQRNRRPYVAM